MGYSCGTLRGRLALQHVGIKYQSSCNFGSGLKEFFRRWSVAKHSLVHPPTPQCLPSSSLCYFFLFFFLCSPLPSFHCHHCLLSGHVLLSLSHMHIHRRTKARNLFTCDPRGSCLGHHGSHFCFPSSIYSMCVCILVVTEHEQT